jgi:hypothetical protein
MAPSRALGRVRYAALCAEASLGLHQYQGHRLRGTQRQSARPGMSTARIAVGRVVYGRLRSNAAMLRG